MTTVGVKRVEGQITDVAESDINHTWI